MRLTVIYLLLLAFIVAALQPSPCAAETPRVEFEIVTEEGLTPATTQKWYQTLTDLNVAGLRIRGETATDQPKVAKAGTKDRPVYRVTGRINARGVLVVPGGNFTTDDRAKIARWIHELANNGVEGVTERKNAFGLTRSQLEEVTKDLMRPVTFSTKGLPPTDAARKIAGSLKLKLTVDNDVKRALAADDPLRDELLGLSSGTALAAILRPAGAALVALKPDGQPVQLRLITSDHAEEIWPIGWPAEQPPAKVLPKLFEFLNAEIEGVTAAEAIQAIRQRLDVPLLMDHNHIVLHRVNLDELVAVPAKRTYYSRVLAQVLFKAGMKYELRVDENEKPFLWITTLKR
ncbi:MAG TPA: hypothetical protein VJ809_13825 [Pirellulales bacterium]|nr:hypothetical protein [Pirellulales bacterium]